MRVTIKEIAVMAGVHPSTVDKVLHNRIGVSDDVRKHVREIIQQVGYTPNLVGRALQKQRITFHIAAVLVDVDAKAYLQKGIERQINQWAGFDIKITYYGTSFMNIAEQAQIIEKLIEERVDGIILSPINSQPVREAVDHAVNAGIPVITTNSDLENSRRTCYIGQDGVRAARVAGRLMGEFMGGCGKIAVVTSSSAKEHNSYYVRIREQEFTAFLQIEYPRIEVVERLENMEDPRITYTKTKQFLEKQQDLNGVYITCGGVPEVGRALREVGREKQIKVLCFEDYPEILQMMREGIVTCTLASELEKQGELPLRVLMEYLVYGTLPQEKTIFTDIKILVKENLM
ncbi:MAG: LacI family DNA-binding transcriptional regulator [Intestinibacillus sp.]